MKYNKINSIINSFLEELDYDFITVDSNDDEMSAYYFMDIVRFDISYYLEDYMADFKQSLKEWYANHNFNFDIHVGTIGLLHEIGHLVAASECEEEELEDQILGYNLSKMFIDDSDLDTYKKLTMEADADRVAYEIYTQHYALVKELERKIMEAL